MPARLLLLVPIVLACSVALRWKDAPPAGAATAQPLPPPTPLFDRSSFKYLGAGSCAAASCHNGISKTSAGGEYALWVTQDPHARAYQILFDERSVRMQKLLGSAIPAHEDQRCLSCHVVADPHRIAPNFRGDGVSCESCHGPAEKWLAIHYQDSWKTKTPAEKQGLGMVDTQSILGRVKLCVECHVGTPGRDVDHDLIAAGHPRLNFEFTAFHANMPHHWPDARDRDPSYSQSKPARGRADFEACAWVAGQLVSAHAALELLADRASDPKKPWPEFAEHDCFACHHDLRSPSPRQQRTVPGSKLGVMPWNSWYTNMLPRALKIIHAKDDPIVELPADWHSREDVAGKARKSAKDLQQLIGQLDGKLRGPLSPATLFRDILNGASLPRKRGEFTWDEASQVYLALEAMYQAQVDMKERPAMEVRPALQEMFRGLEFLKGFNSPRGKKDR